MSETLITSWFFLFGALFGSFANVVIIRMPQGKSVVTPRSHCGSCGKTIPWYDNIPVATYLIRMGKCRFCKAKFSPRYMLVEILMGVLFALAYFYFGFSWFLIESLIFIFPLVICSFIDIDHMILPDEFTLSGIVIGLLGAVINPEREFLNALYGVLLGGGFLLALAYVYFLLTGQEGMGGGDIKLLAWIGAVLGWQAVPFVITVSAIFGTIIGLILARKQKQGLKTVIPYGPYLAAAALLFLFSGRTLSEMYFNLFIPGLQ
ncbi:MAG: prepilin peptidase [Pseudobdellovibrionaceae bacterium]